MLDEAAPEQDTGRKSPISVIRAFVASRREDGEEATPPVMRMGQIRAVSMEILMVLLAVLYFIPFYWMILKPFRYSIFAEFPTNFNPLSGTSISYFISTFNYVWTFGGVSFPMWYFNSIVIALAVVAGTVFIGSLAGYAFARLRFRGRDLLFYAVLATIMIPFPVITISEYVFMVDIHWVNTYQSLIMPQIASAVSVFLFRQYFRTIPHEIEDAAKIDGLRPFDIFARISAPLAKPAYAASSIVTFIGAWNNFIWPLFDTETLNLYTLPLGINFFKGANGVQIIWTQMMMATMLSLIPTFVIFIIFERYFVKGVTLTAGVKG